MVALKILSCYGNCGIRLRLGLHVAIFSANICDDSAANVDFFYCTACTVRFFLLIPADNLEEGEKSNSSRSIFEIEFHSSVWNVDSALPNPVCSTTNIYTYHCNFTWTSCPLSTNIHGEKITAERMGTVPLVSMQSASSVELSTDTCGIKSRVHIVRFFVLEL